jgi:hypothetical protein
MGARAATVFGGLLVSMVTMFAVWRVPEIARFRWDEREGRTTDRDFGEDERVVS